MFGVDFLINVFLTLHVYGGVACGFLQPGPRNRPGTSTLPPDVDQPEHLGHHEASQPTARFQVLQLLRLGRALGDGRGAAG